jgi:hypothetical protein
MRKTHHPFDDAVLANLLLKSSAVITEPRLPQTIELIWYIFEGVFASM